MRIVPDTGHPAPDPTPDPFEIPSAAESPLAAATWYSLLGWHVFPTYGIRASGICDCGREGCSSPGKHPRSKRGVLEATADTATIRRWWGEWWPTANVAIATGASGLVVLDIDPAHGGMETLEKLIDEFGANLLDTVTAETGSGGLHLYFVAPAEAISPRVGAWRGIDIRAGNSYVVAPPSRHTSGRQYQWKAGRGPHECTVAPLPAGLAARLREGTRLVAPNGGVGSPIPQGQRHPTLVKIAGAMRRHGATADEIAAALEAANQRCQPPLPARELRRIAESIAKYPAAEQVSTAATAERVSTAAAPDGVSVSAAAALVRVRDVRPEPVRWLWPSRIPLGKLTILDGDPGLGKSLLSLDIAARVSTGCAMPDGTKSDLVGPAGVVLLSAEDDVADTIRPRLDAAGADCERIVLLKAVIERVERNGQSSERRRLPTLADVSTIREAVVTEGAKLVIIDPIAAYMGGADTKVDAEVRSVLAALAEMAQELGIAVLALRHLTKTAVGNPLYRGGGSIGFIGAARSGLLVARDPQDPTGNRRCLAPTKANLAVEPPTLAYEVVSVAGSAKVEWLGTADVTAEGLLAATVRDEDRPALAEAEAVLREILADGPLPSKEVVKEAAQAGISERTLWRAKTALGVEAAKDGMRGGWLWRLPTPGAGADFRDSVTPGPSGDSQPTKAAKQTEGCQTKTVAAFGTLGRLREPETPGTPVQQEGLGPFLRQSVADRDVADSEPPSQDTLPLGAEPAPPVQESAAAPKPPMTCPSCGGPGERGRNQRMFCRQCEKWWPDPVAQEQIEAGIRCPNCGRMDYRPLGGGRRLCLRCGVEFGRVGGA